MEASGEVKKITSDLIRDQKIDGRVPFESVWMRMIAEDTADRSFTSERRLRCMRLWRPAWKREVEATVVRGLQASVSVAMAMKMLLGKAGEV
jgi:hypothetical protein